MKIKLTNKTAYRDDDLRALVQEAVKQAGAEVDVLTLRVTTQRSTGRVNGRASCRAGCRKWHRAAMDLHPKPADMIDVARFKKTVIHEAMHLAGATHTTMTDEQHYCTFELPAWAAELPLRTKETVAPELRKAAERADRLEHAQAMLTKAQTRAKRANTILKKWKRRVAAMDRP